MINTKLSSIILTHHHNENTLVDYNISYQINEVYYEPMVIIKNVNTENVINIPISAFESIVKYVRKMDKDHKYTLTSERE